jgi:uncharacterized membrane protein YphA (DoxX/SURF4 family)
MSQSAGTQSDAAATAPAVRTARRKEIALRVLQVILALMFAIPSAVPKLIAHSSAVESFDEIGFGTWFMYAIGALELLGAIALVTPWLSGLSAIALIGLMIGAFVTQLTVFDGQYAITPLLLIVPLAIIAWGRRGTVTELAARLRGSN